MKIINLITLLLIISSCNSKSTTMTKTIDEKQVILEFAIKLEQEEINYKHQFEKTLNQDQTSQKEAVKKN